MKILICTDGSSSSIQSAGLVEKLRFPGQSSITILGVSEEEQDLQNLSASMDLIESKLGKSHQVDKKVRHGEPTSEILSEALALQCDLVALGSGGKQLNLLHPQLGATASNLARKLQTHYLVARNVPFVLSRVLVCAGDLASSSPTLNLAGQFLSNVAVQVCVLHVLPKTGMPKVVSTTTSNQKDDGGHDASNDPDALLDRARQQLREAGLKEEIIPILRHGLVVEEVLSELSSGGYDLLVVGSHYQPGQDRWLGTLLDDVTDQLLNRASCSMLII